MVQRFFHVLLTQAVAAGIAAGLWLISPGLAILFFSFVVVALISVQVLGSIEVTKAHQRYENGLKVLLAVLEDAARSDDGQHVVKTLHDVRAAVAVLLNPPKEKPRG